MEDKDLDKAETAAGYEKALAIMAHDLKSPLTAMVSMLGVIKKGYVDDVDKIQELVARAIRQAETLIAMVDDILDYTLLANKSTLKREEVHLYDVLLDSTHAMHSYVVRKNIKLTYCQELCKERYVSGSYTFLMRAFNNILMNAVKYNKENGDITIGCSENPGKKTITITFSDTGIGIPEEDLDKVFKIFERGRHARRNLDGSLGLGLALVKQIIEFHYGEINVTSTVGEGTTITVTLPLLNQKTNPQGGTDES